jgi:hypothetical protein|tara:strand:+ start:23168 stop:23722 length:555 start_codon:yes stop_codon:yes gene_type:complete
MKLYQLKVRRTEDQPEGANFDEWFTSLEKAKSRRKKLIKERADRTSNYLVGHDFEIYRVLVKEMSPRSLLLAALNGKAFATHSEQVVAPYDPEDREGQGWRNRWELGGFSPNWLQLNSRFDREIGLALSRYAYRYTLNYGQHIAHQFEGPVIGRGDRIREDEDLIEKAVEWAENLIGEKHEQRQ